MNSQQQQHLQMMMLMASQTSSQQQQQQQQPREQQQQKYVPMTPPPSTLFASTSTLTPASTPTCPPSSLENLVASPALLPSLFASGRRSSMTPSSMYDSDQDFSFVSAMQQTSQQQQQQQQPWGSPATSLLGKQQQQPQYLQMLFTEDNSTATTLSPATSKAMTEFMMLTPDTTPASFISSTSMSTGATSVNAEDLQCLFGTPAPSGTPNMTTTTAPSSSPFITPPHTPSAFQYLQPTPGLDMASLPSLNHPAMTTTQPSSSIATAAASFLALLDSTPTTTTTPASGGAPLDFSSLQLQTTSSFPLPTPPIFDDASNQLSLLQQHDKYMKILEEMDSTSSSSNGCVDPLLTFCQNQHQQQQQSLLHQQKFFSMNPNASASIASRLPRRQRRFTVAGTAGATDPSNPYNQLLQFQMYQHQYLQHQQQQASAAAVASFTKKRRTSRSFSPRLQSTRRNSFHPSTTASPFQIPSSVRASTAEPSTNTSSSSSSLHLSSDIPPPPANLPPNQLGFINVVFTHPAHHLKQRRKSADDAPKHRNPLWWYEGETPEPIEIMDDMCEAGVEGEWPARKPVKVEEVPMPNPTLVAFKVSGLGAAAKRNGAKKADKE
ncbi:hypothetical protein HDU97_010291 [Phlyctochytrium planicorne]|nr:hypothetical protein HDU97_010291 [Phlyctochytrium planicorne]